MSLADRLKEDWQKGYNQGLKDVETMDTPDITEIYYTEDEEQLLTLFTENHMGEKGTEVSRDYIDGWVEGIKKGYEKAKE